MRNRRIASFVVLVVTALITLSGCHHASATSVRKIRWVNEADNKKVLEVTIQDPSMLAYAHNAVFGGPPVKGTYVIKDGATTVEGVVTQLEDYYRLTSREGKQQRYDLDRTTGSLKDENGGVWKEDNLLIKATLKEW